MLCIPSSWVEKWFFLRWMKNIKLWQFSYGWWMTCYFFHFERVTLALKFIDSCLPSCWSDINMWNRFSDGWPLPLEWYVVTMTASSLVDHILSRQFSMWHLWCHQHGYLCWYLRVMRIQVLLVHRAVATFLALNSTDYTSAYLSTPASALLCSLGISLLTCPSLSNLTAALIML